MTRPRRTWLEISNLPAVRFVGVIFGVAFCLAGFAGARYGLEARHWPWAEGKIVISEQVGEGDTTGFKIVAEYARPPGFYRCGAVHAGVDNSWWDFKAYPVGAATRVYFDPANMARCVMNPGVSWGSIVFMAVGVLSFAAAAAAHRVLRAKPVPLERNSPSL
jgi:hypothetical protein